MDGPAEAVTLYGSASFDPAAPERAVELPPCGTLKWTGDLAAGDTLTIDMRQGTVEDQHGASRYEGVAVMPSFFSIPVGKSKMAVQITGATAATLLTARWSPRRWAVV